MKTAISIPDKIFKAAEQTAQRLGISRSELYSNAVKDYIETHISEHVTAQLDALYSSQSSSLDPNIKQMQSHSLKTEDW